MRAFIVKFPTSFILLWGVFGLYPFYNPTFAIEYREEAQPKREAIQLPGFNPDIVFNIPKYLEKSLHEDIRFGEVCEIGDSVTTGEQQQQPMRGLASVSASRGEIGRAHV